MTSIKMVRERVVYRNDYVTVLDDDVEFPSGRSGRYLRIVESGGRPGVAMLAQCGDRFALVRTYRYPLGEWEWGIPRGFAHDDDPFVTARAELVEEIGGAPAHMTSLGTMTPNSGLLAGHVHLIHASYDTQVSAPVDPDEVAEVRWVDLPTLRAEITDGRIVEGFTLAALAAAAIRNVITF